MEQISNQITDGFIQKLPEQSQFFTPGDLQSAGIPQIIVETLKTKIAETIESELNAFDSDWIQTDSGKVEAAWNAFVKISKEQIKVPASKLPHLLAEAVEQCLKLALKPRQSIPELLFKERGKIDLETVKNEVSDLVVNQQLGVALLRYMVKKEKTEISFEQTGELIEQIDRKLVEDYHTLNWIDALKPVFELAGPSVDSELFRVFFEEKERHRIARTFGRLDKEIDEDTFIEIMSSADLLEVEEYKEEQKQLSIHREDVISLEEVEDEKSEEDKPAENQISEADEPDTIKEEEKNVSSEGTTGEEPEEKEENILNLFSEIDNQEELDADLFYLEKEEEDSGLSLVEPVDKKDEPDELEEIPPLLNKFMFDEDVMESSEDTEKEENDAPDEREYFSMYEELDLKKDESNTREENEDIAEEKSGETENHYDEKEDKENSSLAEEFDEFTYKLGAGTEQEEKVEDEEEEENESGIERGKPAQINDKTAESGEEESELPMWRSFLERDDTETESGYEYEGKEVDGSEEEIEEDEGFIEEPIYDMTAGEPDPEEKISEVSQWLDDEKDRFVKEIFRDSEAAYEQALFEIMDYNDWKRASKYLEREVFSRNRIDVYDEAAVDFTDRLHSYFIENKS